MGSTPTPGSVAVVSMAASEDVTLVESGQNRPATPTTQLSSVASGAFIRRRTWDRHPELRPMGQQWNTENREAYNAYMREYQQRRNEKRIALAMELLGGQCEWCGSTMELEFDHEDPNSRYADITAGTVTNLSKRRFLEELAKCQLLCRPCHQAKTRQDYAEGKYDAGGRQVSQEGS